MSMDSIRRYSILVFFAAVASRVAFHLWTGFVADDAFITFRYAENLAAGLGFVYNEGEQVMGSSTPLFTLLLSILISLKIAAHHGALLISWLACGFTAVIVYRMARSLRFGRLAFLPTLVYIFWPRSIVADSCGMETALFTLLVTAAFYFMQQRQVYYCLAAATMASVTRIEGLLLLAILMTVIIYHDRTLWKASLMVPAMILIPWNLFAYFYFGSPLPHSVPAKLALYSRFGTESPWEHLVYLMGWHNPMGWLLVVAAIAGGIWLNRKQNFGRVEIAWLVGMIAFYTLSRTHLFFWYVAPIYPIYLLLGSASVMWVANRWRLGQPNSQSLRLSIAVVMVLALAVGNWNTAGYYKENQHTLERVHKAIGQYLHVHAGESDIVAAEDIGYMGYYSGKKILDRDGLVSPEAVPYNRSGDYLGLIEDFHPVWVVASPSSEISQFLSDSLFVDQYGLVRAFHSRAGTEYRVYKRDDTTTGTVSQIENRQPQ